MPSASNLLLLAATVLAACSARELQTIATKATIPNEYLPSQGIGPYLQANPDYSYFYDFLDLDYVYSTQLARSWSQGPTNNTILVPTNEAMESGFENLAQVYGVPSNITIYLQLAKGADFDAGVPEDPLSTAIGTIVSALLASHVLTAPINFYANETVLASNVTSPVPLPVSGLNTSVPEAYNNISDGVDTVAIKQSNGLLVDAIYVPQLYAEQTGVNTYDESGVESLYLYEVQTILLASEVVLYGSSVDVVSALSTIKASYTAGN